MPLHTYMAHRSLTYIVTFLVVSATLACIVLAAFIMYPRSALYHEHARELWQQQHISHYEAEAWWASNTSFGHVRVEVLNNHVVNGVDLATGEPLSPQRQLIASSFVVVNNLFPMIQEHMRPVAHWRYQIARYNPLFARWLDPCAALLPQISYDSTYGYPINITYAGAPCVRDLGVYVKIEHFRVLP